MAEAKKDELLGATIGGCEILDVIGHGGMGVIYKARQKSLDRVVAMKVLSPRLADDSNFVSRFMREARAIARVQHANILAVYEVGEDPERNTFFMYMELIDGESLAELQERLGGPLPLEDACHYIHQAAQGLEAAHAVGLTHRDVKPENLLLTRKGVVKVSDFGLAKGMDDATTTSTDAVMGTPAFMSPEQCDGRKVDGRSDIYSLGGSFYKLVTGHLPFEAETAMSMMYRHKHETLVPPCELIPSLPQAVSDVIVRMMAKKPEQRFQSMTELMNALDQAMSGWVGVTGRYGGLKPKTGSVAIPGSVPSAPGPSPSSAGSERPGSPSRLMPSGALPVPGRPPSGAMPGAAGSLPRGTRADQFASPLPGSSASGVSPGVGFAMAGPEDGPALMRRGEELLARGDRTGALKCYRQALGMGNLDPATRQRLEREIRNENATRRQAAEALLRSGQFVEAGRELRFLLEVDPDNEDLRAALKEVEHKLAAKRTLVNDVRTAIAALQFEQAIRMWDRAPLDLREEALGKQIDHLRNVIVPSLKLCEQGESYQQQGRLAESLTTFQDALQRDETCERARQGLAEVQAKVSRLDALLKQGYEMIVREEYAKAIEIWKPILKVCPGHPQAAKSILDAYLKLAQECRAKGDLRGALRCYTEAHEVEPVNKVVSRLFDEVTGLQDKEEALTGRATEAAARGNTGEAIRSWQEVLRLNPTNRAARDKIASLRRSRRQRAILLSVGAVTLLLGGLTAWQFSVESLALRRAQKLAERGLYDEAGRELGAFFLFRKTVARALKEELEVRRWTAVAAEEEAQGRLPEAAAAYDKAAQLLEDNPRTKGANQAQGHRIKALELRVLDQERLCEAALMSASWTDAQVCCNEIRRLITPERAKVSPTPFGESRERASRIFECLEQFTAAYQLLVTTQTNRAKKQEAVGAYRALADRLEALPPSLSLLRDLLKVQVQAGLQRLGYDPGRTNRVVAQVLKLLAEPWRAEALQQALDVLKQEKDLDVTPEQFEPLNVLMADMEACAKRNMVLFNEVPLDTALEGLAKRVDDRLPLLDYGKEKRSRAFCVDRYESGSRAGQVPQGLFTWVQARDRCQEEGKQLCTSRQWKDACEAKDYRHWSFGKQLPPAGQPAPCNWQAAGPAASGSFASCYNQIGAYDMSGNLAEWTLDGERPGEAYQVGGFYASSPDDAQCASRLSVPQSKPPAPQAGFRCCKKLEE